jgi:hypothetical protein
MKIIEVTSCCNCPNRYKISYDVYDDTPDRFNKYVCRKLDYTIASKSLECVIKPMMVCVTTQSITPGITKMIYSADGKTEWNGSIPVWCPLPTGKAGERDKVLDKVWMRIDQVAPMEGIHLGWILLSEVKAALNSLRQSKQAGEP